MSKKKLVEKYFELSNMRVVIPTMLDLDELPITEEELYQVVKDSAEEVYTEEELKAYIKLFKSEAGKSATLKSVVFQQVMQDKLLTAIINKEEI